MDIREVGHEMIVKTLRLRRRTTSRRERRRENARQIRPGRVGHRLSKVCSIANRIDDDLGAYRTFDHLSGIVDRQIDGVLLVFAAEQGWTGLLVFANRPTNRYSVQA